MRVAAVDCGTNSIRLLIADVDGSGLRDVHREMRIVRLGEGVDATGEFAPAALTRTRAALEDYAELMRVIKGDGPCNRQRMAHRRQAHEDGAWVREAAAAYAKKRAA